MLFCVNGVLQVTEQKHPKTGPRKSTKETRENYRDNKFWDKKQSYAER